jgi:hypothetical protein
VDFTRLKHFGKIELTKITYPRLLKSKSRPKKLIHLCPSAGVSNRLAKNEIICTEGPLGVAQMLNPTPMT